MNTQPSLDLFALNDHYWKQRIRQCKAEFKLNRSQPSPDIPQTEPYSDSRPPKHPQTQAISSPKTARSISFHSILQFFGMVILNEDMPI